jgi:hypothetical protein
MKKLLNVFGILLLVNLLLLLIFRYYELSGQFLCVLLMMPFLYMFGITVMIDHFLRKRNLAFLIYGIACIILLPVVLIFRLNHYPGSGLNFVVFLVWLVMGGLFVYFISWKYKDTSRRIPFSHIVVWMSAALLILIANTIRPLTNFIQYPMVNCADNMELNAVINSETKDLVNATRNNVTGKDSLELEALNQVFHLRDSMLNALDEVCANFLLDNDRPEVPVENSRNALFDDYQAWSYRGNLLENIQHGPESQRFIIRDKLDQYKDSLCTIVLYHCSKEQSDKSLERIAMLLDFQTLYELPNGAQNWDNSHFYNTSPYAELSTLYNLGSRVNMAAMIAVRALTAPGLIEDTVENEPGSVLLKP